MKTLRHIQHGGICLVILGLVQATLGAEAANSLAEQIGKEHPFAMIETLPSPAVTAGTDGVEEPRDLKLGTVVLKFLDAKSLQGVLAAMVKPYGAVSVNEANNSVVLCDTPEKLEKILAYIRKADQTPQQVAIEVLILDVQLDNDTEIGVNWDLLTSDRPNAVYRQNFTSSRLRSTIEDSTTLGDATAFNTIGLGGDFSVISGTVRAVLHLIQQKRDVEILASPRALVVSGRSATIQAVEEIPYQEISDSSGAGQAALTTTKFKNVGITLQVTAIIADSNNIFLTVDTEQNVRTGQSTDGIPVVDTRRTNTAVSLRNGQTVILGGLRREQQTKQVSQVPLLGDLPILGNLFKSTRKVTHNSELVVLLSPHIDTGAALPESVATRYEAAHSRSLLSQTPAERADDTNDRMNKGGRARVRD
ncbi:MAG: type II secretion system protein GspD [Sedimentisphaerales bacterium]|nr:type II secretion system protein GspD [Sedimentisphaerales bacterium]